MTGERYDAIGRTYATTRIEDPRIAAQIHAALAGCRSIVNVGAGTGNYEPRDATVIAVEPSPVMLAQRSGRSPLVIRGAAEHLPLPGGAVDAAMAILTLHHWSDLDTGLRELRRVAPRQVVFYFEPFATRDVWMLDYFPEAAALPTEVDAPGLPEISAVLHVREVQPILVPRDCVDGFGAAFWCRPEAYLDPVVQAGMSWTALLDPDLLAAGNRRLAADLESGAWRERYAHLLELEAFDAGYRLAICGSVVEEVV